MVDRTPLIAGNWKMYKTKAEAVALAEAVANSVVDGVEVMIAPPFTSLAPVAEAIAGTKLKLGAQNLYPSGQGARTGEICPEMLTDLGVSYVIVGHSERRQFMTETDEFIRDKVAAALEAGLIPVLCVGESLEQREAGQTEAVIEDQLARNLAGIELASGLELVVAYEPVWAIGTGRTAAPEQAQEVHDFIRRWLADRFDKGLANSLRILYGGSVNAGNVRELMAQPDLDGALVGGASLEAESFSAIVGYQG